MPGKPSIERRCPQCSATFFTWPVYIRKGQGKFCSVKCASKNRTALPLAERLWPKVMKTDGCWWWLGSKSSAGYGQISRGRKGQGLVPAHRAVYELVIGPIPDGLELDHLCGQPSCVRPEHLEAVTHQENVLRGRSPMAALATVERCPKGHPYDDANTYRPRRGGRMCRTCHRERNRSAALRPPGC